MAPVMPACSVHVYAKVPLLLNVNANEAPAGSAPFQRPVVDVVVWAVASLFCQVTVDPCGTVTWPGVKDASVA